MSCGGHDSSRALKWIDRTSLTKPLLAANRMASNRQTAAKADVSHPMVATVRTDLRQMVKTTSAKTTGKNGKKHPARKPRQKPAEAS
jgi:hypothetical protein